jgi:hypothetical protein
MVAFLTLMPFLRGESLANQTTVMWLSPFKNVKDQILGKAYISTRFVYCSESEKEEG